MAQSPQEIRERLFRAADRSRKIEEAARATSAAIQAETAPPPRAAGTGPLVQAPLTGAPTRQGR